LPDLKYVSLESSETFIDAIPKVKIPLIEVVDLVLRNIGNWIGGIGIGMRGLG
jgi:hypothetical protein